jgi:hypothetical protein
MSVQPRRLAKRGCVFFFVPIIDMQSARGAEKRFAA